MDFGPPRPFSPPRPQDALYATLDAAATSVGARIEEVSWVTNDMDVFQIFVVLVFPATGTRVKVGKGFGRMPTDVAAPAIERDLVAEITEAGRRYVWEIKPSFEKAAKFDYDKAVPDSTTEIIGYRRWRITTDAAGKTALRSSDYVHPHKAPQWDGAKWVKASCGQASYDATGVWSGHAAPDVHCHCGWNAYHDFGAVSGGDTPAVVVGAVLGKGTMMIHPQSGWRAEWARPLALTWLSYGRRDGIRALGEDLGIPVIDPDKLEAFAREHGDPVPEEALAPINPAEELQREARRKKRARRRKS